MRLLLLVGMSWILLYKSIVEAKYCDRFTRWLSSFISHQIQCNMVCMGHLLLFESLTVQVHLLSICIWLVDIQKYWVTFILFAHSSLPFNDMDFNSTRKNVPRFNLHHSKAFDREGIIFATFATKPWWFVTFYWVFCHFSLENNIIWRKSET